MRAYEYIVFEWDFLLNLGNRLKIPNRETNDCTFFETTKQVGL